MTKPANPAGAWVMIGAGAALAVGSFLPWIKVLAPFIGTVTKSGMEGSDGWGTLAAGVALMVLAALALNGNVAATRWGIAVSFLVGALVFYEFIDIHNRMAKVSTSLVSTSYGTGLYLCAVGVVAGLVGSMIAADAADKARDAERAYTPSGSSGRMCANGHENTVDARFCSTCRTRFLEAF